LRYKFIKNIEYNKINYNSCLPLKVKLYKTIKYVSIERTNVAFKSDLEITL